MTNGVKKTEWQKGPPPMIGEWETRLVGIGAPELRAWWNGERWSCRYHHGVPEHTQRVLRRTKYPHKIEFMWRGLAEKPANFAAPEPLGPL